MAIRKFLSFVLLVFCCMQTFAYKLYDPSGNTTKWGGVGLGTPGGLVTYSFLPAGSAACSHFSDTVICDDLNTALNMPEEVWQQEIIRAFSAWSSVANIDFALATNQQDGDIRIGAHTGFSGSVLAHAVLPRNAPHRVVALDGDIHFNANVHWKIGKNGPGTELFLVAVHEIGHSIGLVHEDTELSIMSTFLNETLFGLQQDDINGVQALYGARVTVPEPSTVWLLLIALLVLFLYNNKKNAIN